MKYFRVEEEWVSGVMRRMEVASDGEQIAGGYDTDDIVSITIGYHVFIEDEGGRTEDVEFYPVRTDMETFDNDHEQVLDRIRRDFSAPEWQNNSW